MSARICPYCREKIHPLAVVCRWCGRDLPSRPAPGRRSAWRWLPAVALTAALVAGVAFTASEFLRERRYWLE